MEMKYRWNIDGDGIIGGDGVVKTVRLSLSLDFDFNLKPELDFDLGLGAGLGLDFELAGQQSVLYVQVADTFFARLRGLMLRSPDSLPMGTGLLIAPCSSIHMMFMRFAIDVVYITKEYEVIKCVRRVLPWVGVSISLAGRTWAALELPAGSVDYYGIAPGMRFYAL